MRSRLRCEKCGDVSSAWTMSERLASIGRLVRSALEDLEKRDEQHNRTDVPRAQGTLQAVISLHVEVRCCVSNAGRGSCNGKLRPMKNRNDHAR